MLDVIALAVALSMDAFAISISLGVQGKSDTQKVSLIAAGYFGVFHALMPILGYWLGHSVLAWVDSYASWVAFLLLSLIGSKMLYESFFGDAEENFERVTHKLMLALAVAASIDAMAAGFVLTLLSVNIIFSCILIGVITLIFSYFGVLIGAKGGNKLRAKSGVVGGVVLIFIGFKILLF